MTLEAAFRYIDDHLEASLDALFEYARLPTVSAHGTAIEETAQATVKLLQAEGFETRVLPKPGGAFPVVYAYQAAGPMSGRADPPPGPLPGTDGGPEQREGGLERGVGKTLLFYNHYDVQPPDPMDEWTSPPFEPQRRGDAIYGRGISDDKGNIVSRMLAIRAVKQAYGGLPCNVKFFVEGDEEIGSPQIAPFMHEYGHLFAADACIWEWGYALWDGSPTLMLGAKGLLCVDIEVQGPNRDVHSSYGTVVPNPAWRLAWALGSIKDPQENILIDGFYDGVKSPTEDELAALRLLPDDGEQFLDSLGLHDAVLGVKDVDYRRRHIFEPTCTINGLTSGYQGLGTKTVLPARASAKLDFRLVDDQDPDDLIAKLRAHLERFGFDDVVVRQSSSEKAARTPMDDPFIDVVQRACVDAYGREAYLVPSMAATGPMYHFVHDLGLATVMAGINYVGGRDHAPDEHVRIEDYRRGTKHIAAILQRFAEA